MPKHFFKAVLCVVAFSVPALLFAQPTFGSGVQDVPIDQQTLLLASGGIIYAVHKFRQHARKRM